MIILLTGPNSYAITQRVKQLTDEFEGEAERFDAAELDIKDLPDLFTGATLFTSKRLVVIKGISDNKQLWGELERWIEQVPDETTVILIDPSPDKRTKTYKLLQKHATVEEYKEATEADLRSWVQQVARAQGMELAPDVIRFFLAYVGHDQWRLSGELDKLILAGKPVTQDLIREISEPYPEASAFELLDSAFAGRTERVEELLDLLSQREDPYQFFGLLSSQVMALLALVSAGSRTPADIARDLGLHPFVVSKLAPVARKLGKGRITSLVDQLAHCDTRIKTTGVDPWYQVRLTLLSISNR